MRNTMIKAINFYRLASRLTWRFKPLPIYYSQCKFYPTCSEYSQIAIDKYGVLNGAWLAFIRIIRCNPFNKGGYDPVK